MQNISTERNESHLLTREQAAQRINCSTRNLHELRIRGELPFVKIGKLIRFIPKDLDAYIQLHRIASNGG